MNEKLKIQLVAPTIWQPVLARTLAHADGGEQEFVRAGLGALQRRHVGITPGLMAALAKALLQPHHSGAVPGAWGAVYGRLLKSLHAAEDKQRQPAAIGVSLTLSDAPVYMLMRIVAPVIQAACQRLRYACLLCADTTGTSVNQAAYEKYDQELTAAIVAFADDKTDQADLFWRERALSLSSLTREREDVSLLPAPDPVAVGVFLRLRPERKPGQEEARRSRHLSHLRRQRDLNWREEGFDGIHLSHSDEDLPYRLITEYLYDRPTQVDRILNSGFLALEREPRRIRIRDVLIVAYLPGKFWHTVQADFLRACWFDFTMRAALILRQNKLLKSEFRWIEADGVGRSRTVILRLEEMPDGPQAQESTRTALFRQQFCASLRWLPRIMDVANAGFRAVREPGSPRLAPPSLPLDADQSPWAYTEEWIASLWSLQEEDTVRSEEGFGVQQEPLRAEEFVYTFHMPFLPISKAPPTPVEAQKLNARLDIRMHASRPYRGAICLTWAPVDLAHYMNWRIVARGRHQERLLPGEEDGEKPDPKQLGGLVVDAWLEQFLKETPRA